MTCCGEKIKNIAKGVTGHVVEKLFNYTGKKSPYIDERIETCTDCEFNTWLSELQYLMWISVNGVEFLKNFTQLEKLPMLPKMNTGKNIYCRICKCFIPGKARTNKKIEDMETYENCPKGFWKN